MQTELIFAAKLANSTVVDCENFLHDIAIFDSKFTTDDPFTSGGNMVEKFSYAEEMPSRVTRYHNDDNNKTSWQTGVGVLTFMGNMADPGPPQPLFTHDEILYVAEKLAHDRSCSVKLALALVQCRLDAERRYR